MSQVLVVLAVLVGLPGAGTALHLGLLAVASLLYRTDPPPASIPKVHFLVLVPAHNEERVISVTLASLATDLRPGDHVLVVADRCTDATVELAAATGALVLERDPGAEPGRAAARQAGVERALSPAFDVEWDAMVMIDADSIIEPGFFTACEAALASGAEALQARSEAALGPRLLDQLAMAASALQGLTIPRGRDRLGLLVRLRGTGMVLSRRLLTEFRFRAPASEDLWFSLDLCLAGIHPRHVEAAKLRSLNAGSWEVAGEQRVRYEAGRMSAAREFVWPMLRRHDAESLEAALFLLTPPFAVAAMSLAAAGALAFLSGSALAFWASLGLLAILSSALGIGLLQAGANARTWLALALAPWYLPWKAVIQVRALLRIGRGVTTYAPTPR